VELTASNQQAVTAVEPAWEVCDGSLGKLVAQLRNSFVSKNTRGNAV
jgi:hypothetical protein